MVRAVTLSSPSNGDCYATSTWPFKANVVGDLAATEVNYFVKPTPTSPWEWAGHATSVPWTFTENYAYGSYLLKAEATLSNNTTVTSPEITWTRGPTCPYEPPPTTTTTTTTPPAPYLAPTIQTPANNSCTTNQTITFTATPQPDPANSVASISYNIIGNGTAETITGITPSPFTATKTLPNGTYTLRATAHWQTYPPATTNPTTFTIAPTCTPTTTTTTTTPTTTTTTLPPPAASLVLNVPSNVVPGEVITGSITNVLASDTVTVAAGATVVQTLVPAGLITFRSPAPGTYAVTVSRNGTTMSSASFTVVTPPTVAVAGSMKEGFPLTAAINGPLDTNDRVRIDTLGQAEIRAACTDPAVNKPAGASVTFANTPKAGTYQVRVLRRDQTVAVQTITIDPLPKATLTLWRVQDIAPTVGCTQLWSNAYGNYSTTYQGPLVIGVDYDSGVDGNVLNAIGKAKHVNQASTCPVNIAEPIPYDLANFTAPTWWAKALHVTVSGYTPLAGDNVIYGPGPGGTPIVTGTNVWFTPASLALANGDTHVTFSYRTTINGSPVIIGQLAAIIRRTPVIGAPVCVVSAETAIALTKSTALPSDSWTTVGDCSNPIIMFLVPGTGEELPNQRKPDGTPKANDDPTRNNPTNPNAPPKPSISVSITPNPDAHWLEHGVLTDLKNADGGGCLRNDGTTLSYLATSVNNGLCMIVMPARNSDGTWKLYLDDDQVEFGCLTRNGSFGVLSEPCGPNSDWIETRVDPTAFLFRLSPAATTELCLSKTLMLETCSSSRADQLWQDGAKDKLVGWFIEHDCSVSLLFGIQLPGMNSCDAKDYKELLKGAASVVVAPVTGIANCAGTKRAAAACARTISALTAITPSAQDTQIRLAVAKGMVAECIDRTEYCIGSLAGGYVLGRASSAVKAAVALNRTNRAAAAAAKAAGLNAEAAQIEANIAEVESLIAQDLSQSAKVTTGKVPPTPQPVLRLTETAPGVYTSPEGITYGAGGAEGHRLTHVLEHARPKIGDATHTVFKTNAKNLMDLVNEVTDLIDRAWVKRGPHAPGDAFRYDVLMGEVVGMNGERALRIIIDVTTMKIITAYPI